MRFGDAIWGSLMFDAMSAIFIASGFLTKCGEMLLVLGSK